MSATLLIIIWLIYTALIVIPMTYLLILAIASLIPQQPRTNSPTLGKIVVLIPAHNESETIARTIASVSKAAQRSTETDIYVIADNCDDDTADIARAQSFTKVWERQDKLNRGKGAALSWAIDKLAATDYCYLTVIDADSVLDPNFFVELRKSMAETDRLAMQSRYEPLPNSHSGIRRLAMLGFNVLRPLGKVRIGGSAGILGNGFTLSRELLEQVPFEANSVVEDLEYHITLTELGHKVGYSSASKIWGEMPYNDKATDIQSARWEGGRITLLAQTIVPLCKKIPLQIRQGNWSGLQTVLELSILPLGYQLFFVLAGAIHPQTWPIAGYGLAVIATYTIVSAVHGNGLKDLRALLDLPHFLFQKILRIPQVFSFSSKSRVWKTTPRK